MAEPTGIDPAFQQALEQMFAHAPRQIAINSGFRSHEEQKALHDRAEQQHPGEANKWAAQPGTSWHEFGYAADLRFADDTTLQWAHDHAEEYGLFFPMSWEPWHIQPLWTKGRKVSDAAPPTGGTTQPPEDLPPEKEEIKSTTNPDPLGRIFGGFRSMMHTTADLDQHPYQGDLLTIGQRWHNLLHPPQPNVAAAHGLGAGLASQVAGSGGGTAVSGGTLDYQQTYDLLLKVGATPEEARMLAAFAGPESGYDTSIVSKPNSDGTFDRGLFQINDVHKKDHDRLVNDPAYNAEVALEIFRTQGPSAWTVYKTGAYEKYLPGTPNRAS
jgi:hypothetical protein